MVKWANKLCYEVTDFDDDARALLLQMSDQGLSQAEIAKRVTRLGKAHVSATTIGKTLLATPGYVRKKSNDGAKYSPHTMRLAAKVEELAKLGHGIRRIAKHIDRHPERVRQLMKITREEGAQ